MKKNTTLLEMMEGEWEYEDKEWNRMDAREKYLDWRLGLQKYTSNIGAGKENMLRKRFPKSNSVSKLKLQKNKIP